MESEQRLQQMKNFLRNFSGNNERLEKYLELLMFEDKADPQCMMTRQEGLRRIGIALTTKCNLDCVWCCQKLSRDSRKPQVMERFIMQ